MEYRAVKNRCAVNLKSLQLPISEKKTLTILQNKGFKVLEIDMVALARKCVKISKHHRGARLLEAPTIVDCSSFIKWLYGQRGIWLPRRSIQQRNFGRAVSTKEIIAGDVLFTSGWINYYQHDPSDGVGHVGIATGEGTVIHATNKTLNVIESPIETFIDETKFRGAKRYIPKDQTVLTLETPENRDVEIDDDIRWIVLQSLSLD